MDLDTREDSLRFYISQSPMWGSVQRATKMSRVERSSSSSGSGSDNINSGSSTNRGKNSRVGSTARSNNHDNVKRNVTGITNTPTNNKKSNSSSSVGVMRTISSFTLSELKEGSVQYVQSNLVHENSGPPTDSFLVYVTDGKHNSTSGQVEVSVIQQSGSGSAGLSNLSLFSVDEIMVDEGSSNVFQIRYSAQTFTAKTGEKIIGLVSAPKHGQVNIALN